MSPKLALCMPWTDRGDVSRRAAHDWCLNYWQQAALGPIFEGSGRSRPEMCNAAARKAIESGAEVLFFVDSDTWTPVSQVRGAAHVAERSNRLVHAFTTYCRVDQATTKRLLAAPEAEIDRQWLQRTSRTTTKHVSGASAISVDLWNDVGGFDERFDVWGMDDVSFDFACGVLSGGVMRIDGPAFHWWHRSDPNKGRRPDRNDPRVSLIGRYCSAAGRLPEYGQTRRLGESGYFKVGGPTGPEAMLAVLSEVDGPLGVRVEF